MVAQIRADELALRLGKIDKLVLLDVRETWECEICQIPGSLHVPMGQIPARLGELNPEEEIVVVCHHGVRSYHTAIFLSKQGFTRVINLQGGIDAWAKTVDPTMAVY